LKAIFLQKKTAFELDDFLILEKYFFQYYVDFVMVVT